ncbi:hypothetical protein [Legionella cardiaca]|uniref:Uncharacterized protein n=1 Tax=Legionella cardiaca TaxID=1071983 RepID=A0ABY8ASG3_9GAMM|nr:hypothetical protein [Legionella cardiaca]WED42112.1 hypothetical protein PXX05_09235 [Legionella cardiaca]
MFRASFIGSPTVADVKKNEKKYHRCDINMEIMLADLLDLTDDIYDGLLRTIKKPASVSAERFKKILYVKATIFNLFIGGKIIIDKLFDDLEKECAANMLSIPVSQDELLKLGLCPQFYKSVVGKHKVDEEDEVEEVYYSPIISKEILEIKYPDEILAQVLKQQLQKHDVNIASEKRATFLKTQGWLSFFGVVPPETAIKILKKGMIFIDAPDYPDSDSRLHGAYSHAIQEYLISKLLEGGYLGDLSVKGEPDITELELVQADAWLVKHGGVEGVHCLFDIMRERRPNKLSLLNVYPDEVYGFTSPDFVNQYLMLNPFRFPCLSTLLYNQYAHATQNYFNLLPGFNTLSKEEQLHIMNIHDRHNVLKNDIEKFVNNSNYIEYQQTDRSRIMLKRHEKPLFRFPYTQDDSKSYIRARKITETNTATLSKKFHAAEVLLDDYIPREKDDSENDQEKLSL